jgi:hypothetical protein
LTSRNGTDKINQCSGKCEQNLTFYSKKASTAQHICKLLLFPFAQEGASVGIRRAPNLVLMKPFRPKLRAERNAAYKGVKARGTVAAKWNYCFAA